RKNDRGSERARRLVYADKKGPEIISTRVCDIAAGGAELICVERANHVQVTRIVNRNRALIEVAAACVDGRRPGDGACRSASFEHVKTAPIGTRIAGERVDRRSRSVDDRVGLGEGREIYVVIAEVVHIARGVNVSVPVEGDGRDTASGIASDLHVPGRVAGGPVQVENGAVVVAARRNYRAAAGKVERSDIFSAHIDVLSVRAHGKRNATVLVTDVPRIAAEKLRPCHGPVRVDFGDEARAAGPRGAAD